VLFAYFSCSLPFLRTQVTTAPEKISEIQKEQPSHEPKVETQREQSPEPPLKQDFTMEKESFCNRVNDKFATFGWHKIICNPIRYGIS